MNSNFLYRTVILLVGTTSLLCTTQTTFAQKSPKLVLQLTIDALRQDLIHRYSHVLGEGGFKYLQDQGVNYSNAHYQHSNTETIVGHVSLATGTIPAVHGMIGNVWFDRGLGRMVYNIEDSSYQLLTSGADIDQSTEIDPTQRAAKVEGRSPYNILSSTLSDEIAIHFAGRSKIFAVSVKDRGAVSLAGNAGKAFWFSKAKGEFITTGYYFEKNPEWLDIWNSEKPASQYAGKAWELLHDKSHYVFGDADYREYEVDFPLFGRIFPHRFGLTHDKLFTTRLTLSPAGDRLTLDFAKTLLLNEQLGQDAIPDFLGISFSSTDYVGHLFGPSSLEMEDNIAHLDRTLAELFMFIDQKVGLDNTLIVLSADHGLPEAPGSLHALGISKAKYFDTQALDKKPAIQALKATFGLGEELIEYYFPPYLYLNRDLIKEKGLDQATVEKVIAKELVKFDGIATAISSEALRTDTLPDTRLNRQILNNFHPKRSGDIYLVFEPNVFINDFDGLTVATTHGSPWTYDTHVPVIFAGNELQPAKVSRPVTPYDISVTIAEYLGIKHPSGAIGVVLEEVVRNE
ncbi:MAG: alkaline phosphatase family protein [Desulfobulbaceae bacterium]|nr:MAG: alkaline phosphatase family protein [Desulfobulbaceae bacterium]